MSRRGVQATVAGGAVVMAALVVSATAAPVPLLARSVGTETRLPVPTFTTLPSRTTTSLASTSALATSLDPSPLLVVLVQVVLVATAMVLLVVLVQLVRSLLRRRPHLERREEPDFTIPLVPSELLDAARDRLHELETGEPRNAIVAAWLGLEGSAAATGLPRLPAETSSEYTQRVIRVWAVDSDRLADLAALYREARFSVHALGESHRRRAIADLAAVLTDLEHVAAEQAAERAAAHAGAHAGADGGTRSRPGREGGA